ncbi:MAG: hypothetical protein FJ303_02660 [Planctomycetes bacterium]|nr:hypothetical protein [Planctomycetota bacterium]
MFSAEVIKARLNQEPFRPLRIIASEGLSYDIYHPDRFWIGWSDIQIGFAHPDHPDIYNKTIRITMSHVVGLEDIPAKKSSKKS